ncbi:MAG: GNAT family N-acetyltransferase [Myxococcaceae bacterium]
MRWQRGSYEVDTTIGRIDTKAVHAYLSRSYWAEGISPDRVERSVRNSLCFGVYNGSQLIGFARVISDRATCAYLCDVFILEEHQGKGLGIWLMECVQAHSELASLRRWILATLDAHGLYEKTGFGPLTAPERFMEKIDRDVYKRETAR